MARIVLNTFGSLGDLNPYLALAIRLRERGHQPLLATSEVYRHAVIAQGIGFAPVRPNVAELLDRPELLAKVWHPRRGSEFLLRDYIIPHIEESYQDLLTACKGADLILTHAAAYAGPIVAEVLRTRWISIVLQPILFFSAEDPPFVPAIGAWNRLFHLEPALFRTVTALATWQSNRWAEPIHRLRARLGLPLATQNPIVRGLFSPLGTLALFSRHFAAPQRDWPPNVRVSGFVFYDQDGRAPGEIRNSHQDSEALSRFLAAGSPPVLFTLGSSAVLYSGSFLQESIAAVKTLGMRAVMLLDRKERDRSERDRRERDGCQRDQLRASLPDSVFLADYQPYSEIMPRCAAIVHHGGIGTTAQALRAGRPMLVVPWAHDQPDNAARLRKLGVARTIPRARYTAARIAAELASLLQTRAYAERAADLAWKIAGEDGLTNACDAIEQSLNR